jgi:putative aldouronate transport system permease protein
MPDRTDVPAVKKKSFGQKLYRQRFLLLMLLPGLIWFIVFKFCTYAGLALAFTNYGFKKHVDFVGLRNFERVFKSAVFWNAFRNTLLISLYNLIFYFPFPLIIALLINELKSIRARRTVQFLIYIPYFFSWVVVGTIFVNLLSPSDGIVNHIINLLGGQSVYFMANPKWFRSVLISSYIWRQMGYGAVIYVATLSTVDPQLYEAAKIDGCGRWKQTLYVTLPSIRPTIITMLLLNLAHVLMIFEQVLVMYNASVYSVSDVLQTYTYREGILSGNVAYGTAISLFTGIVSFMLVMGTNWISRHFLEDSIL